MEQNSVQAPNFEDFQHVPSPSALKTKSMEDPSPGTQELSLDKPNYDVFPPVISLESVLSFISTALSVVCVFFLLVVFAAHLLTVALTATSNWPWITMEKLIGNGKGRESYANNRTTNNLLAASSQEKSRSNSMKRSKETNNPNQHDNHRGNHSFNTSPNNPRETANAGGHGFTLEDCFNNFGDGEQDMSHLKVNISTGKSAFNNHKSGLQSLSRAEMWVSRAEDGFNKKGIGEQTFRSAKIGEPHNPAAVKRVFNNDANWKQFYDNARIYGGKIMYEYQSPN